MTQIKRIDVYKRQGLNIAVKIDGVNQLCVTDIPEHSQIYLYGDSNTEDKLCICLLYTSRCV